jgi:hypothetical protein
MAKTAAYVGASGNHPEYPTSLSLFDKCTSDVSIEAVSKPQITFEGKTQVGEKAEHTR